jgi:hypothetical protein
MKAQISISEAYLRNTTLPVATDTYTVIPHGFVIDTIRRELAANNFEITSESFFEGDQGDVAEGEFFIQNLTDPQMGMVFHWQNSYNKKVKFGCAIAGMIYDNQTTMIGSTGAKWLRKHTGTAFDEAEETIKDLCSQAADHFQSIIDEKNEMLKIPLTDQLYGIIMGRLFFEKEFLNQTQAVAVFRERKKPMFEYTDRDTLWGLYKYLMFGIQDAGMGLWQVCQQRIHMSVMLEVANYVPTELTLPKFELEIAEEDTVHQDAFELVLENNEVETEMQLKVVTEPVETEEGFKYEVEAHVESDQEYLERVAEIEGEPEVEQSGFAEGLEIDHNLGEEEVVDAEDSELVIEFSKEEEAPATSTITSEAFVDHMLDTTKHSPALIYQYAGEQFKEMESIAFNQTLCENWITSMAPDTAEKPKRKKTVEVEVQESVGTVVTTEPSERLLAEADFLELFQSLPHETMSTENIIMACQEARERMSSTETPAVEATPEMSVDIMAELTAAAGDAPIMQLDESDLALLNAVQQNVATPTIEGVDFMEISEPVIEASKNQFADRIEARIKELYKKENAEYTHQVVDGFINVQLTETSEVFYLEL